MKRKFIIDEVVCDCCGSYVTGADDAYYEITRLSDNKQFQVCSDQCLVSIATNKLLHDKITYIDKKIESNVVKGSYKELQESLNDCLEFISETEEAKNWDTFSTPEFVVVAASLIEGEI